MDIPQCVYTFTSRRTFSLCPVFCNFLIKLQIVKNLPVILKPRVWPLIWEDLLEKGMATHSSSPTWRILWAEEPGGLQFMGSQRVGHDWVINTFWRHYCINFCVDASFHLSWANIYKGEFWSYDVNFYLYKKLKLFP